MPAHYEALEKGLITVFKSVCAEHWNDELQEAWHIAIDNISKMMIAAQAQNPGL
jgi:hemoglobin-like flavoprotein